MSDQFVWHAANNGSQKMRWFVCRDRHADDPERGSRGSTEYLYGSACNYAPSGRLRKFASYEAAQKVADALNVLEDR